MSKLPSEQAKQEYWRANLRWLAILLGVWALASYGCGVFFVDFLDQFKLPGSNMNLGFWFTQQGAIYLFVIILVVYSRVMDRLDRQLLKGTDSEQSS